MRISTIMTQKVALVRPDDSIQTAATKMGEVDTGVLPVAQNDQLVGMITDRDIVL
jgi:predicted transcriptional regulator